MKNVHKGMECQGTGARAISVEAGGGPTIVPQLHAIYGIEDGMVRFEVGLR